VRTRRTVPLALAGVLFGAVACTSSAPRPATRSTARTSTSGSSTSAPQPVACPLAVRDVLRAASGATVTVHTLERDPQLTDCRYTAAAAGRRACRAARLQINDESQAYVDFRRWVDESGQNRQHPRQVPGPGLGADWVVQQHLFQAGSATRWVTVTLDCPPHTPGTLPLARHIATIAMRA